MKRTINYIKKQNTSTEKDIRKEIINFRDKRLLEEQEEQNNVIIYRKIHVHICVTYFYSPICLL